MYIGAGDPLRRGLSTWTHDWTNDGTPVVDSGVYTRDDAHADTACRTIAAADVILIGGGRAGVLYDTLAGTSALDAVVAASDRGAVVVGTSGSSQVMGSRSVNPYGDDGVEPEPTFAWLPEVIVSTHHRDTKEELDNLRRWLWPTVSAGAVLLVPERGAVWVDAGWERFEPLASAEQQTSAKWWTTAHSAPTAL